MRKLLMVAGFVAILAPVMASAPVYADDAPTGWPPDVKSREFDRDGNRTDHLVNGGRREYRKDGFIFTYDKDGKLVAAVAPVAVAPPPAQTTPKQDKPVTGFTDPEERKRIEEARKKEEEEKKKKKKVEQTTPPSSEGIFDEHFRKIHEAEKKLNKHGHRANKRMSEKSRTGEKLNTREKRASRTATRSSERGRSVSKERIGRASAAKLNRRALATPHRGAAARLGKMGGGNRTSMGRGMMGNRMPMGRTGGMGGMGGFRPGGMGSLGRMRMGMR